jgi:hypothetical protein
LDYISEDIKTVRQIQYLAPLFALLSTPLLATDLPVCGVASLATYESYGSSGCSFGPNFVFEDFQYTVNVALFANDVTAEEITVTPTLSGDTPTFDFTADWAVQGTVLDTGTYIGVLGFRGVSSDTVFGAFNSVQLETVGSSGAALANVNTVTEEDCVGGLLTGALCSVGGGTTANIGASINGTNLGANAVVSFTPASSIDVIKTITLTSVLGQSDTLTSVGQVLGTDTPEPMSLSTMAGGLVAVGFLTHKRFLASKG